MPQYELEVNGRRFQVEAPSQEAALAAAQQFAAPAEPSARQQSEEDPLGYLAETARNAPASAGRAVRDFGAGILDLGKQVLSYPSQTETRVGALPIPDENTDLGRTIQGLVPGILEHYGRYTDDEERARMVRDDPFGVASDMAGLVGGAQAGLKGASKVAHAAGRGTYRLGVTLSNPTIKREFGAADLAARGYDEGVPLTARGAEKARDLGLASADQADDLIAQHAAGTSQVLGPSNPGQAPGFVSLRDAIGDVRPLYDKVGKSALGTEDPARRQIQSLSRKTAEGHQWPMPLTEAQALKRAEQEMAHRIYRTVDGGGHVPAPTQTRAQFGKAVAGSTQRAIEREVPEVAPINARTQDLLGLQRLAERASVASHWVPRMLTAGSAAAAMSPHGALEALAAAGTTAAVTSPGALSNLAMLMRRTGQGAAWGGRATPLPGTLLAQMIARQQAEDERRLAEQGD